MTEDNRLGFHCELSLLFYVWNSKEIQIERNSASSKKVITRNYQEQV